MADALAFEELSPRHDRTQFSCGKPNLDDYLKRFSRQNDELRTTKTVVVRNAQNPQVLAYYAARAGTVACSAPPRARLPADAKKRLPSYPLGTFHLARMAVDSASRLDPDGKPRRLGELMLMHALKAAHTASRHMGIFAVDVIAIDDDAAAFYRKYDFAPLVDNPRHLFLPMKKISSLLA